MKDQNGSILLYDRWISVPAPRPLPPRTAAVTNPHGTKKKYYSFSLRQKSEHGNKWKIRFRLIFSLVRYFTAGLHSICNISGYKTWFCHVQIFIYYRCQHRACVHLTFSAYQLEVRRFDSQCCHWDYS
jgi:hypothetical protein